MTAEAQRFLNELGYNAGPVDGLIGGKTRNAMSDAFKSVGKEWDRELEINLFPDLNSKRMPSAVQI